MFTGLKEYRIGKHAPKIARDLFAFKEKWASNGKLTSLSLGHSNGKTK